MKFGIGKFEIILTAIICGIILLAVYCSVQKEKARMSVNIESAEDVYNALYDMSEQAYENIDPNSKLGMWLADKKDEMRQKFDLDEDKLTSP